MFRTYVVFRVCVYLRKVNLVWICIEGRPAFSPPFQERRNGSGAALSALCTEVNAKKMSFSVSRQVSHPFWDIQSAAATYSSIFCVMRSIFSLERCSNNVMVLSVYNYFLSVYVKSGWFESGLGLSARACMCAGVAAAATAALARTTCDKPRPAR